VDHAQQRADRQLSADLEPWVELVPGPAVHPDLAAPAALPTPDEHRAEAAVRVTLLEGECFADPQAGTPEQHDQRAKAVTVSAVADRAHDRDDLLNARRIGRVPLALVAWWTPSVIARHSRGRSAVTSGVQQHGFHESSLVKQVGDAVPFRTERPAAARKLPATGLRCWCPPIARRSSQCKALAGQTQGPAVEPPNRGVRNTVHSAHGEDGSSAGVQNKAQ
jgi:hypothetical protein